MNTIKIVGRSGQISLGKKFAGQAVMIDEIETGVWIFGEPLNPEPLNPKTILIPAAANPPHFVCCWPPCSL